MTGLCSVMKKRASIGHGMMEDGSRKTNCLEDGLQQSTTHTSKGKAYILRFKYDKILTNKPSRKQFSGENPF